MSATNAAADLILYNGRVETLDPSRPAAEAVACTRGRIAAVGADDRIRSLAGPATEQIDMKKRLLLPGFTDAHIHFYEWAVNRHGLNLADLPSLQALAEIVGKASSRAPAGKWILGQGWNETDWEAPQMPTRDVLDEAAPDHPVLLWRCDLHLAAANSKALAAAGIGPETADPPEGCIERDRHGRPTGILRELAINRVRQAIPRPSSEEVGAAFLSGASALHRLGITGIHDIRLMNDRDGETALQAFSELHRRGRLPLRCWVTLPAHRMSDAIDRGLRTGMGDDRLRVGHVKFFYDGGVGARTAWMTEPYLDGGIGMPMMPAEELAEAVQTAEAAGLSVMIHAVGDRANRDLVELFSDLSQRREKPLAIPHRIEHMQVVRPEDAAKLADLDIAVSVTPPNMILDINLIDAVMGERGRWAYAFRRLIDTGSPVMFSSDCPVCDPNPMAGIHAAVTRQRIDGTPAGGWYPEQRVSVDEAVRAYTQTPARVHGLGNEFGSISEGKRADLVVLEEDIYTAVPARIADVKVDLTVFDGKVVFRRQETE
ncbi:MAG: amidohydrolase [Desulfobacterales bacterium]|nr:amidohydrolase [Desulfobacterales bacterium]